MNYLNWIKENKKLVLLIIALIGGVVCVATGAITWDQLMDWLGKAAVPVDGGG